MKFLGIDAGGTKTHFVLCNENGRVLALDKKQGFSLEALGCQGLHNALLDGMRGVMLKAGSPEGIPDAVCFGAPCLGENAAEDIILQQVSNTAFHGSKLFLCNDSHVAWAGSFALKPGINVVAGTGAIAFGCDKNGNTARCGGWYYEFSDEGSGYWLGKRTLELFCKESDGRCPRGPLYDIIRKRFSLAKDFDIIPVAQKEILHNRDQVAALQLLLYQAAEQGDKEAISCYCLAANEIAMNVRGIVNQLSFDRPVAVSCSGGVFKAGRFIQEPFFNELEIIGCVYAPPIAPPWAGAAMLAMKTAGCLSEDTLAALIMEGRSL